MIEYILAHFIGDWLLQPRTMDIRKSEWGISGLLTCIAHVSFYTAPFFLFLPYQPWYFYLSIAIPHFIIDRWSLMKHWEKMLNKGVDWYKIYFVDPTDMPKEMYESPEILPTDIQKKDYAFLIRMEQAFHAIRYVVAVQTAHMICLYLTYKFIA